MNSGRKTLLEKTQQGESWFRWRGQEISRVEGLFDATVALAMTFVVVSLEMPRTFDAMIDSLKQFPVFVVCCLFLVGIWYVHFKFHRRYGLEDIPTIVLNTALIILVLFFVYPMRYTYSVALGNGQEVLTLEQGRLVMGMYAGGFAGFGLIFMAMYGYAYTKRDSLELTEAERICTRFAMLAHFWNVLVSIASIAIILFIPKWIGFSGIIFATIGPIQFANGMVAGKKITAAMSKNDGS